MEQKRWDVKDEVKILKDHTSIDYLSLGCTMSTLRSEILIYMICLLDY